MKVSLVFVAFTVAFSCCGAEVSSFDNCSKDVNKNDCEKYNQKGLNFTICQWRHIFPTMANMNLDERNKIYSRSKEYCYLWKESELNLIPDVEGTYCTVNDSNRAALCAKYKLARVYWQIEALKILLPISTDFSQEITYEMLRILQEIGEIKEANADLLNREISFPTRDSNINWRSTLITNAVIVFLGVLYWK
jgi:hypothetical protein